MRFASKMEIKYRFKTVHNKRNKVGQISVRLVFMITRGRTVSGSMIEEELHLVSVPFYFMTAFRVPTVYLSLLSREKNTFPY